MAKASIHLNPLKGFTAQQGRENERRGWTEKSYQDKNQALGNHYDWSRHNLNFEIDADGKIKSLCSNPTPIHQRLEKRLNELGFKKYKAGTASNDPICCVDIVVGGDHDRMCQIAFGSDHTMNPLSVGGNSHIHRTEDIEAWALDTYHFACRRWGKENIMGMEVHLDETTPHAHLLMVPVASRKQRGRVAPGKERKDVKQVSYGGIFGDKLWQRKKAYAQVHTDYHREVGSKWGLERGNYQEDLPEEEQRARKHKDKHTLEAERLAKENLRKMKLESNELQKQNEKRRNEEKAKIAVAKAQILDIFGKGDLPKLKAENQSLRQEINKYKKALDYRKNEIDETYRSGLQNGQDLQRMTDKQFIIAYLKKQGWKPTAKEERELLNRPMTDILNVCTKLYDNKIDNLKGSIELKNLNIQYYKQQLRGREKDVEELAALAYPDDENMRYKYSLRPDDSKRKSILTKEQERERERENQLRRMEYRQSVLRQAQESPKEFDIQGAIQQEFRLLTQGAELTTELLNEGIKMFLAGAIPADYAYVPSSGGGGSNSDDNKRRWDDDDEKWAKRCARALANKSSQPAPRRFRRR